MRRVAMAEVDALDGDFSLRRLFKRASGSQPMPVISGFAHAVVAGCCSAVGWTAGAPSAFGAAEASERAVGAARGHLMRCGSHIG